MIIDNKKTIVKQKLTRLFVGIGVVVIVSVMLTTDFMSFSFWLNCKYHLSIIFCSLYILFLVYMYYMNYHYIYFSDEEEKFILRYHSTRPLNKAYKAIEIPKKSFYKYEITQSSYFGKKILFIFQKTTKGIAKYKGVNISALNKDEIIKLKKILLKYSKD